LSISFGLWGGLITLVCPLGFLQVILIEDGLIVGDKNEPEVTPRRKISLQCSWWWEWLPIVVIQVETLLI